MNDPLLGPRLKLVRAEHHLVELEAAERAFFDANPCRVVYDTQSKPGTKLVKVVLDAHPPEAMHVVAGEFIYQLRSTLDQCAVAFARLSSGNTVPEEVHFPTGNGWKDFRKNCLRFDKRGRLLGNLRFFDADLRKAILKTQPYDGGNDDLRAVFPLSNIDKHMELIAIGSAGGACGMDGWNVHGSRGLVIGPGGLGQVGDLNQGVTFLELDPDGFIAPNKADAKLAISGNITFGGKPPYRGKALTEQFRAMLEAVWGVYEDFERVLNARGDIIPALTYLPLPTDCPHGGSG